VERYISREYRLAFSSPKQSTFPAPNCSLLIQLLLHRSRMPAPYDIDRLDGNDFSEIVPTMDPDLIWRALSEVNIREFDDFRDSGYDDQRTFLNYLDKGVMEKHIQKLNEAASEAATKTAKKRGKKQGALLPDDRAETVQAPSNAGSHSGSRTAVQLPNTPTDIQPSNTSTGMKPSDDTPTIPITTPITSSEG
jgi:hypothetical protein